MSVRVLCLLRAGRIALRRGIASPAGPFGLVLRLLLTPMLGSLGQVDRRIDQPEMGESLREVSKELVVDGVDLLGEEPDIIGIVERAFKEIVRGIDFAA